MRGFVGLAAAVLVLAALIVPASAARMALIVGNAGYQHTAALATPKSDATAFADFLRSKDFEVTVVLDATRPDMARALGEFVSKLTPQDTALFYYAGHGLQVDGTNYLMGVDAKLLSEFDIAAESMDLSQIVAQMEKRAHVSMIFIDACRDNPLADKLQVSTRGISVGLAPVDTTSEGTMIAFAAAPGRVAFDGYEHSPFTSALIANLGEPQLEVATAFKRVIRDVRDATDNRQVPQIVSTMSVEFYFGSEQPVEAGVRITPGPAPTLTVVAPEPTPAAQPTVVAALPAEPTPPPAPAPAAAPVASPLDLDFAAAKRLGSLRAMQLFLSAHRMDPVPPAMTMELTALVTRLALAGLAPDQLEAQLGLDSGRRAEVQRLLIANGYDLGAPDGALGPASRRQIAAFQTKTGDTPNGYLTPHALALLGLSEVLEASAPVAGPKARRYALEDLSRLETDPRLLRTAACLKGHAFNYGFFEGHIYLAVQSGFASYQAAVIDADRCGGHLVSFSSAAENEFAFSLIRNDPLFFRLEQDEYGGWAAGPLIGLRQEANGKEPSAGWVWASGETSNFRAWARQQPDDFRGLEDVAHYWFHTPKGAKFGDANFKPAATWNDETGGGEGYIMELD